MTHGPIPHVTTTRATIPNGIDVFYRTSGPENGPVVLLLHGFPASSFQFRNLIPRLANVGYRVVAPDLPGFGFTTIPSSLNYKHTFANLASTVGAFLDTLSIQRFAVYVFDYGAPTGFRLALERPDAVTAIFSQNGNAYDAGLGEFWDPIRKLWTTADGSVEETSQKEVVKGAILTYEATKWQYTEHEPHPELVDPASWTLDWALMSQPGNFDVQLSLFKDYGTNVKLYPQFQEWMKKSNVPVLAVWGEGDEIFIAPGAEAFRELPNATVELVPGGHFLVESQTELVAEKMVKFLKKNVPVSA